MLYNQNWNKKPDDFSLEALIAWLEQQPPDSYYDSMDADICLLGQWVKSIDKKACRSVGYGSYTYDVNGQRVDLRRFERVVFAGPGQVPKYSFGAALKRAKALLAKTKEKVNA